MRHVLIHKITPQMRKILGGLAITSTVFGVGVLVGASMSKNAYAQQATPLESPLFAQVRSIIDEKFIMWKASSSLPTSKELEYGMIAGYVASYKDPYTVFFPPVEAKSFSETVKGSFGGVGMTVGMKDGSVVVIAPLKDSPAMKAGVKAGDFIVAVDGKSVIGEPSDQVVSKIRGEIGTTVKISVMRTGSKNATEISIVRDEIKIPTIDTEKKDGVFIIHLYNFSAEAPEGFRKALNDFLQSGTNKLIIDLRGNPGGYLEAAVGMASYFLDEGKVVVSEKHGKNAEVVNHRSQGIVGVPKNTKVAVVVDGGSASASEILAGALRDQGVAVVVGEKSFGKGSVQELINLPDNTSIKVTIAKWYTPNGTSISEQGIVPDYKVTIGTSTPKNKDGTLVDVQINKAIEVLNGNK